MEAIRHQYINNKLLLPLVLWKKIIFRINNFCVRTVFMNESSLLRSQLRGEGLRNLGEWGFER